LPITSSLYIWIPDIAGRRLDSSRGITALHHSLNDDVYCVCACA